MGFADQIKYAKILYLANVLDDIQNEMGKDYHCRNYLESLQGIVKDIRETIDLETQPNGMKCEPIEIKRLEYKHKVCILDIPIGERDDCVRHLSRHVQEGLLRNIADGKLIHISKHDDGNGMMTFAASLIVGIENTQYIPKEPQVTFVDGLAKHLDEKGNK